MSHEKLGAIQTYGNPDGPVMYGRKTRGITLPYDKLTAEERKNLSGPVKTYFIDKGEKNHESNN